jgi:hypothetical protein
VRGIDENKLKLQTVMKVRSLSANMFVNILIRLLYYCYRDN